MRRATRCEVGRTLTDSDASSQGTDSKHRKGPEGFSQRIPCPGGIAGQSTASTMSWLRAQPSATPAQPAIRRTGSSTIIPPTWNTLYPIRGVDARSGRPDTRRMLACVRSATVLGVEADDVFVEVDVAPGLPSFTTVGLPDSAVRESRDRVRAAIRNAGLEFPMDRITVNL